LGLCLLALGCKAPKSNQTSYFLEAVERKNAVALVAREAVAQGVDAVVVEPSEVEVLESLLDHAEGSTTLGVEDLLDAEPNVHGPLLERWASVKTLRADHPCAADGLCVRMVQTCAQPSSCVPLSGGAAATEAKLARRLRFLAWPIAYSAYFPEGGADAKLVAALEGAARQAKSSIAMVLAPRHSRSDRAERIARLLGHANTGAVLPSVWVIPRLKVLGSRATFEQEVTRHQGSHKPVFGRD
jgi:hypothetical protein